MTHYEIIQDDVINWAKNYTGMPFMACFCDPPYHLTAITKRFGKPGSAPAKGGVYRRSSAGFMSQSWDGTDESGIGIAFQPETWAALGEHLYPGGFLMAFAGTRGYHRMACAIEDAGFIIHPALVWTFLSGFPKATRIDTQIDKAAGVEREVIGQANTPRGQGWEAKSRGDRRPAGELKSVYDLTTAATELAQIWAGHRYGLQALKPSLEFLAVAQKPYVGRPVDCITRTGAGAWNIDGGRIGTGEEWEGREGGDPKSVTAYGNGLNHVSSDSHPLGRWPANLLLDEAGAALLDRQSGEIGSSYREGDRSGTTSGSNNIYGTYSGRDRGYNNTEAGYHDSGGASRMFFQSDWQYEILEQLENADPLKYEPKVSTTEREAGLDELEYKTRNRVNSGGLENDPKFSPTRMKNNHPTLKPISLTKYLAGLLLPPDAYAPRRILVPFGGSGSEAIGCVLAGWESVTVIESSSDYVPIAEARLAWWSQWPGWGQMDVDKILASLGDDTPAEQLTLFEATQ